MNTEWFGADGIVLVNPPAVVGDSHKSVPTDQAEVFTFDRIPAVITVPFDPFAIAFIATPKVMSEVAELFAWAKANEGKPPEAPLI